MQAAGLPNIVTYSGVQALKQPVGIGAQQGDESILSQLSVETFLVGTEKEANEPA